MQEILRNLLAPLTAVHVCDSEINSFKCAMYNVHCSTRGSIRDQASTDPTNDENAVYVLSPAYFA
jgi:hypothetical protein